MKILLISGLLMVSTSFGGNPIIENFENLDGWKEVTFPKIPEHTQYTIERLDAESVLKAFSDNSASGIVFREKINVYETPLLEWRWKIMNVIKDGDAQKKSGDDYPLRIYVMFEYNPDKSDFFESVLYESARFIYGEYPPHSSLNYIWANREQTSEIIPNSYTDKAQMIITEQGTENLDIWLTESVNILEDYQRPFGENPPTLAAIAIMSDSDNTGENAIAYVDYLLVRSVTKTEGIHK